MIQYTPYPTLESQLSEIEQFDSLEYQQILSNLALCFERDQCSGYIAFNMDVGKAYMFSISHNYLLIMLDPKSGRPFGFKLVEKNDIAFILEKLKKYNLAI